MTITNEIHFKKSLYICSEVETRLNKDLLRTDRNNI